MLSIGSLAKRDCARARRTRAATSIDRSSARAKSRALQHDGRPAQTSPAAEEQQRVSQDCGPATAPENHAAALFRLHVQTHLGGAEARCSSGYELVCGWVCGGGVGGSTREAGGDQGLGSRPQGARVRAPRGAPRGARRSSSACVSFGFGSSLTFYELSTSAWRHTHIVRGCWCGRRPRCPAASGRCWVRST